MRLLYILFDSDKGIDMFLFWHSGSERVTQQNGWAKLASKMGVEPKQAANAGMVLR